VPTAIPSERYLIAEPMNARVWKLTPYGVCVVSALLRTTRSEEVVGTFISEVVSTGGFLPGDPPTELNGLLVQAQNRQGRFVHQGSDIHFEFEPDKKPR